VTLRRTGLDLTVEREVVDAEGNPKRFRLTGRFDVDPDGVPPTPEEVREQLRSLSEELDRGIPQGLAPALPKRPDRPLAELIETYRPRQVELLDLLLDEGEITEGECGRLRQHLAERAVAAAPDMAVIDRPIAAAPLAFDRAPTVPRPVPELLELYRIESLKQAGAVRGRRQISYEEYMALKRHFSATETAASSAAPAETRT
jgi:hypothetical protein